MEQQKHDFSHEWAQYKSALEQDLSLELKTFCTNNGYHYRRMQDWIYRSHFKISTVKSRIISGYKGAKQTDVPSFVEVKLPASRPEPAIQSSTATIKGLTLDYGDLHVRIGELPVESIVSLSQLIKEMRSCSL